MPPRKWKGVSPFLWAAQKPRGIIVERKLFLNIPSPQSTQVHNCRWDATANVLLSILFVMYMDHAQQRELPTSHLDPPHSPSSLAHDFLLTWSTKIRWHHVQVVLERRICSHWAYHRHSERVFNSQYSEVMIALDHATLGQQIDLVHLPVAWSEATG